MVESGSMNLKVCCPQIVLSVITIESSLILSWMKACISKGIPRFVSFLDRQILLKMSLLLSTSMKNLIPFPSMCLMAIALQIQERTNMN